MKLRRIKIENVRSFLAPTEVLFDGDISIIIGPNGGGKTNLLDIATTTLRRHVFKSWVPVRSPTADLADRYEFRQNSTLEAIRFEKHSLAKSKQSSVEVELEVTAPDIASMHRMKASAKELAERTEGRFFGQSIRDATTWELANIAAGQRYSYQIINDVMQPVNDPTAYLYQRFLALYEIDSRLREEVGESRLAMPMLSLPVNRTSTAFQSSVSLATHNEHDLKFSVDAANSRSPSSIVNLAIGRLARRFRMLLERDNGNASSEFRDDKQIKSFSAILSTLGYEWDLVCVDPLSNAYEVRLKKQGAVFLMSAASSGEKELLTYLFAVYALDLHDALVVVDEPELHLHPRWQATLLSLFGRLAAETGNQFVFATHSPVFVSPTSIHHVSRVFSSEQQSHVVRLATSELPQAKHLFSIVNSHNNERLFFADFVVLVEGISDRLFFEALARRAKVNEGSTRVCEIISVGGKGLFGAYERILKACHVPFMTIADLDYVEQVGGGLGSLFATDFKQIDEDVIQNPKSRDGASVAGKLDEALTNGDVAALKELWDYIKGRQRKLRTDLTPEEKEQLAAFHAESRAKGLFVLRKGALEDYLPAGHKSKDVEKLIEFLGTDFWSGLASDAQAECDEIVGAMKLAIEKDAAPDLKALA